MTDALDLLQPYLDPLGTGFASASAPDGTPVLATPFRFLGGSPLEVAVWREGADTYITDRGLLLDSLLIGGVDAFEVSAHRDRVIAALAEHGVELDGSIAVTKAGVDIGAALHRLIQALLSGQAAGREGLRPPHEAGQPRVYRAICEILNDHGAPFQQDYRVRGLSRRTYHLDFRFVLRVTEIVSAALVVISGRSLEQAERWHYRFRDIHGARPRLQRLAIVDDGVAWSDDAQVALVQETELIIGPGDVGGLDRYLRAGGVAART